MVREYYLKTLNMTMEYVVMGKKVRYEEAPCYHPTVFTKDGKATLVYYSEDGLVTVELTKFSYNNRIFKAYIDDAKYDAIKINVINLLDHNGKRVGELK